MSWLATQELRRLTCRVRFSAQRRALERMAIPYATTADGEPLVRADYQDHNPKPARTREPRWDRIS